VAHLTPAQSADAQRGAALVRMSTWLLFGGFVVIMGGCGGAVLIGVGGLGTAGIGLGLLVVVAAAVVGQIGRGLQGRVI
jgi:hypothetical protein